MASEKTVYTFYINDTQSAYQLIMNYLNTYNFKYVDKKGMPHYEYSDYITAKKFFEFYFQGNQLTIYAYLKSMKKPMPIDKGSMGAAVKKAYRNELAPLLEGLSRLMMSANQMYDPMQSMAYGQSVVAGSQQAYQNNNENNADTMAITSFILAIIGLVLSWFGFVYGAALMFMEIWTAIAGMKSSRFRVLAILALVLCALSFVFIIPAIELMFNK